MKSQTSQRSADSLPLPRRLWWPWDEPATHVGFARTLYVEPSTRGSPREVVPQRETPRRDGPRQGLLYVTASGAYTVYLDGRPLCPESMEMPPWREMRRFPLSLSSGTHRLSIEALPGPDGQPFVLGCLDWQDDEGAHRLPTDDSWQMVRNPAPEWVTQAPDLEWRSAWAFDGVWAEPWGMPCNAPDDFCRLTTGMQEMSEEALVHAKRLHQGLPGSGERALCGDDGTLILRPLEPFARAPVDLPATRGGLEWYRVREAQSRVANSWLDLFERRAPHVLFELDTETFARVKLRLSGGGPAVVAVTTAESLNEIDRYDRRVTDVVTLRDGETFTTSPTGFRYVKVMGLGAGPAGSGEVVLEPVVVQHIRYPVEMRGAFACSDETLNAIWDASVRTAHLCMQTEIWDGIKRDQLPWTGDLYIEALVTYHVFGDANLARRTYAILGELGPAPPPPLEEQRYPGLQAIWRVPSGDINDIPTYTLWWLVGLADYVRYTGDLSLIRELRRELVATLDHVARRINDDGLWCAEDGWDFVDWAPLDATARWQFTHFLAYQAIDLGVHLLLRIGASNHEQAWKELLDRMVAAARLAWRHNGLWQFDSSHHVPAMAIRSGVLAPEEAAELFAARLAPDPEMRMTFWHRYADLDAAAQVGEVQWGLDYIRDHWGAAVEAGLDTLWETFDRAWLADDDPHALTIVGSEYARYGGYETSLCHGWSAGPVPWLHRAVLGVRPAKDGSAEVTFAPALGDLAWAKGTVPTPLGDVHVTLRRTQSGLVATLQAPRSIAVHIPDGIRATWELRVIQP
ncbi:MAG: alpha-L-rhamnosidase C-terminal domain-containing protein [Anaerolineae bacterium]